MSRRRGAPPVTEPLAGQYADQPLPPVRVSVSGGCTVTTLETAREAAWAALTFHAVHGLPVLIACDDSAYADLAPICGAWPSEILLQRVPFPPANQVRQHNAYHRTDAIAAKMLALKLAIAGFGDAVFFDADMTFLHPLPSPEDAELILSPNFENFVTGGQHGIYNAGLVWSSSAAFADWWRDEYVSGRSKFYEQSALDAAPSRWRSAYFGAEHNWGFWRGPISQRRVSSIHCHLSTALDHKMSQWALDRALPLRAECLAHIAAHPILSCLSSPL